MDLGKIAGTYIQRLVEGAGSRARILLLDSETTGIVSLCSTQSLLLKNDIFLVDRLENSARQKMRHLDCVCFVRPSSDSISALVEELRAPMYASYVLLFSNALKKSQVERLAEADDFETVTKVQEMYLDMYIINRSLFSSGLPNVYSPVDPGAWRAGALDRAVDSIVATLLSLKAKPLIRFESNSALAQRLAVEVSRITQDSGQNKLFDFKPRDTPPILLLLDRRNDPVTPLLSHWTYQAMVDELIGIQNNRVDLTTAPGISEDLREIVLSAEQDPFFAEAMHLNFGDLGARVKDYVAQYQTKTQSNKKIESVADMKRFVEEYPEFRKLSGNVSKHVALVGELSRIVESENLLNVSEAEQSLACTDNHATDLRTVQELIASPSVSAESKYRLVALYAMRYEDHNQNATSNLLGSIEATGSGRANLRRAVELLTSVYSGIENRQEDIFSKGSLLSRAQMGLKGLKGAENVYTQHKPLLEQLLSQLGRGKLRKQKYPFFDPGDGSLPQWARQHTTDDAELPQDIIVYVVGGVTYEEERVVHEFNAASRGVRITLGGTSTINSHQFLENLGAAEWPVRKTAADRLRASQRA